MKNILVTGGSGFIGANFVPFFCKKYPDYHIVNMDSLTYAANAGDITDAENYTFVRSDIREVKSVESVFKTFGIDTVVHFAAESHVDNSIANPAAFIETNIIGTFNLLTEARNTGSRFHHVSTDEVYGQLGETGYFTEETPYAPSSPYSASKASSDMLVRAWNHTYGLQATISNCSNNYGPKQNDEKLIPTIIRKCMANQNIPVYGDGKNIRDWLYVLDHCKAIDLILHNGKIGETYNVGGHNERNNLQIVNEICGIMDKRNPQNAPHSRLISFVKDRPGHDFRYAIDASKIEKNLGWKAEETFATGIVKTVDWYLARARGRS